MNSIDFFWKEKFKKLILKIALERLCMQAPGTNLKNECKSLVDLYSVFILKLIAELDTSKTCHEIKLC